MGGSRGVVLTQSLEPGLVSESSIGTEVDPT